MEEDEMEDPAALPSSPFSIGFPDDKGLLACDLFAILVASQLMGLLDVVNDPEFVRSGGWLQPIPAVPSTLNVLLQRIAVIGVLWFPLTTIRMKSSTEKHQRSSELDASDSERAGAALISQVLFTTVAFTIARVGLAAAIETKDSAGDWILYALRDGYFVGLATASFRWLYQQYVR